jgi:hypothetical protein
MVAPGGTAKTEVLLASAHLRETLSMTKPRLVILSEQSDPILKGQCSSCEGVTFSLANTESSLGLIHSMFTQHLRKAHMQEDASQAKTGGK